MKRILILGVNGFIGHHLSQRVLAATDWEIYGMDMQSDRVEELLGEQRFHFFEGDITINKEWIEYHIRKCDTVVPLVAIATPATYVKEPLRVFELDFEANLPIVRACVRHGKRLVFPSTSEVYGMSPDRDFDPEQSPLVYGPINRQRWIYACSKQLMDRVIWAYGQQEGLDFTLFRPFNWIGAGLDSISTPKEGSSRVVTQFFGHIVRGERIQLVDGGRQKRAFTYIEDGIDALMAILANRGGIASGKIYNIGNPRNNLSVRELARTMVDLALEYPEYRDAARKVKIVRTSAERYYGRGYQDMQNRVPNIVATKRDLGWRRRDLPFQPRAGPYRPCIAPRIQKKLSFESPANIGARTLRDSHPSLRHAAAGAGHRPPVRGHDARDAGRRFRGRDPLLGPRALAGLRRPPRCRLDRARDEARLRALRSGVPGNSQDLGSSRLANQRACSAFPGPCRLCVRLGHARHPALPAAVERGARGLPAIPHYAADSRRADRAGGRPRRSPSEPPREGSCVHGARRIGRRKAPRHVRVAPGGLEVPALR